MTEVGLKDKAPLYTKYNKSAMYLLPLLAKHVELDFRYLILNTYVNLYLDSIDEVFDVAYPFGVLYNVTELAENNTLDSMDAMIKANNHYLHDIDVVKDDSYKKLYVFKFPMEYVDDYKLFRKGRYSQFSPEAKKEIVSYTALEYKYQPIIEDIVGILFKRKDRKAKLEKMLAMSIPEDVELGSIMNEEEETFKI